MTKYIINLKQEKYLNTDFVVDNMYRLYYRYSDYCFEQDYIGFLHMALHLIRNTINTARVVKKMYLDIGMITWVIGCLKKLTFEEFINGFVDGVYVIDGKLRYTKEGLNMKNYVEGFISNRNLDDCIEYDFNHETIEFISVNEFIEDAFYKMYVLKNLVNTKVLGRAEDDLVGLDEHVFETLGFSDEKDLEDEFAYGENHEYKDDYKS